MVLAQLFFHISIKLLTQLFRIGSQIPVSWSLHLLYACRKAVLCKGLAVVSTSPNLSFTFKHQRITLEVDPGGRGLMELEPHHLM